MDDNFGHNQTMYDVCVRFMMCLCYDDINLFLCVITLVGIMTKILAIENPSSVRIVGVCFVFV